MTVRVLVLGGDGFLGWPTALRLSAQGHDVAVLDSFIRRSYDHELGVSSLVPVLPLRQRLARWHAVSGNRIRLFVGDLTNARFVHETLAQFGPDTVVHFAEQRSAPYSMIDQAHAVHTQVNNVVGTLNLLYAIAAHDPSIHLIKLGTMGEYGTPNIDIEEGFLPVTHRGRTDVLPFPMQPGSFYHLSKVHDSNNIMFACRTWGLRATDLHQGIVYGCETEETRADAALATRFDYDAVFGTVLNRFVVQAVLGHPLTVYGSGGQTRGLIDIRDTVSCIALAAGSPPEAGQYRVFNQFTQSYSVIELAGQVAARYPGKVTIEHLPGPRVEAEDHYYRAAHTKLLDLGLVPHLLAGPLLDSLFDVAAAHQGRADPSTIRPRITWRDPVTAPHHRLTPAGDQS